MYTPAEALSGQILSVTDLTSIIKELLEGAFPSVCIEGEISNYRPSSTGHVYFTLKDDNAAISAVLFKGRMRSLSFTPRDGMTVKVTGSLSVYAQRGSYQIVVETMERSGAGDILRMLEERKQKLAAEGLFDSDRKRSLPFFPLRVAVVTSPTGAAVRDILQIIKRRNKCVSVNILPCAVQGADAPAQIARMIRTAGAYNLGDVLIVGRGGGSLEDLLPFSDEAVVRAVAASPIPVISAVGHEIDWALTDFAADMRAPTPSAAAELAVPLLDELQETLERSLDSLEHSIETIIERKKLLVRSFSIDSLELRLRSIEQPLLQRFDNAKEELLQALQQKVTDIKQKLMLLTNSLEDANPRALLERGYSIVRSRETGAVITSAAETKKGEILEIIPARGIITAETTEVIV